MFVSSLFAAQLDKESYHPGVDILMDGCLEAGYARRKSHCGNLIKTPPHQTGLGRLVEEFAHCGGVSEILE